MKSPKSELWVATLLNQSELWKPITRRWFAVGLFSRVAKMTSWCPSKNEAKALLLAVCNNSSLWSFCHVPFKELCEQKNQDVADRSSLHFTLFNFSLSPILLTFPLPLHTDLILLPPLSKHNGSACGRTKSRKTRSELLTPQSGRRQCNKPTQTSHADRCLLGWRR